jgi:Transposase DDE domain
MVGKPSPNTKPVVRFAAPPWNEHSAPWRQIDTQLPQDHLAREIRQAMTHLDLTQLYDSYAGRGKAPHRPDLMLAIVLFELRRGQRQPSQWFQDTQENCALWWLGYGIHPSRSCWYEFRDRTGSYLDRLNRHVLHQAVNAELTRVERGALDGSAVAANASRRRLINAERLQQRGTQLESARQDDAQGHTPTEVPAWMAQTPRGRTAQHERYRQAQEHLAGLQAANQQHSPSERRAPDKIVVSTSDPEAALGVDKDHVFRPLYTIQTVRDVDSPLIVSYDVFAQATDAGTLPPMLERTEQLTGRRLKNVLVDSGYVTGIDLALCAQEGVTLYGPWKANDVSTPKATMLFTKAQFQWLPELETYRCPAGHVLKRVGRETCGRSGGREEVVVRYGVKGTTCHACPLRPQCTTSQKGGRSIRRSEHEDVIIAHQAWMETEEAKAVYRLRGQTIEIVFADFKEHRGLRRFSGHGLARARTELALEVLVHNLLVLHRFSNQKQNVQETTPKPENIAA